MKNSRHTRPEKKIKVTMWIQQKTKDLIAKHSKYAGISYGQLADITFQQKLQDPIEVLEDEKRKYALEITRINDEIERIQEMKKGDQ